MFSNLSKNLTRIFDKVRGRGLLTDADVNEALREIRVALLEADVALPVVKEFTERVRGKAIGANLVRSVSPGQVVIKIVSDELIELLKSEDQDLNLKVAPPAVIMMVGLQGSGKTTSSAKLAYNLKKKGKKPLLASLDIYRPAAQKQLEDVAKKNDLSSLEIIDGQSCEQITKRALNEAQTRGFDVLILDTAGRLHTDDELINELKVIKKLSSPIETLLVADSLSGQDAVNVATHFNNAVDVSGIVLTRCDGDARGGAALSMRHVTQKPIKFIGVGEKIDDFEPFIADRIGSRILGMGDVVSLVEKAQDVMAEEEAERVTKRLQKGLFDLNDLYSQLKNIGKMGGVGKLMGMIPGINKLAGKLAEGNFAEEKIKQQLAIIESMTKKERRNPLLINPSRKRRIADGCGQKIEDVNRLLKQYNNMMKMMKRFGKISPSDLERMQRMMNVPM